MKKILMILTVIAAICLLAGPVMSAVKLGGATATYIGLSSDTKPTTAQGGQTFLESDTGLLYYYTGSAWALKKKTETSAVDTLTAAGAGTAMAVDGFDQATLVYKSAGESISNFFTLQGKVTLSGMGWGNLDSNGATNATDDSTGFVCYKELADLDSIRAYAYAISSGDSLFAGISVSGE